MVLIEVFFKVLILIISAIFSNHLEISLVHSFYLFLLQVCFFLLV